MRAVVLLAMLMFVLRGCTADSDESYSTRPDSAADQDAPSESVVATNFDPFVEGSSYRFVIKASDITPGLENSSAVVKVSIRDFVSSNTEESDTTEETDTDEELDTDSETSTDDEAGTDSETSTDDEAGTDDETSTDSETSSADDSIALAANSKVRLDWVCGEEEESGHQEIELSRLDVTLSVTFKELPALKRASDSIQCEVDATLDTTRADGERVIATGSHEFYIEMDVLYPALKLHSLNITEDTNDPTSSALNFKVALIRQGKAVEKGDPVFDNEVEVALQWRCNDTGKSKSDTSTDMIIAAGRGEAETQLSIPNRPTPGESGYACMIDASSEIDGYERMVEGKKKLWIEGKDLQVAVTAVSSASLSYAVMVRYQQLSDNVKLSIEDCTGVTFSNGNTEVSNIASSGDVTLSGTGNTGCRLKAEVMDMDSDGTNTLREGVSQAFAVPAPAPAPVPPAFK